MFTTQHLCNPLWLSSGTPECNRRGPDGSPDSIHVIKNTTRVDFDTRLSTMARRPRGPEEVMGRLMSSDEHPDGMGRDTGTRVQQASNNRTPSQIHPGQVHQRLPMNRRRRGQRWRLAILLWHLL